jgi:polar amino acid transport system substrate-binding protein
VNGKHRQRTGLVSAGRAALALAAVTAAALAAGCAAAPPARQAAPGPPPAARAQARAAAAPAAGQPQAAKSTAENAAARRTGGNTAETTAKTAATCDPQASSLAPLGPPQVTTGSFMAKIRARGYLIAGVDQSTYHFGYLNPLNGHIEGFDIDMIRAVAQGIFGNPDKVEYKAISDAERVPDVENGTVDIVAHTMTITCQRLAQVDFSSVYFEAHQRVLVPDSSHAAGGLANLGGQKVCATTGSDSVTTIQDYPSHPKVVQVPYWTDCLVLLQQDQVAAVSTDDAILYGLAAQDPFTKVVGPELTNEPYGLAISKQHQDFVRFVNAVLAKDESDGAWEKSYQHWVSPAGQKPPAPKYAG